MSDSTIPEADAAETKFRAEWLHKHKAHKDWIILSVSEVAVIRDELLAVKRERDEAQGERDKLAAALINCMPFISGEGCGEYSDAKLALQSLTPNEL